MDLHTVTRWVQPRARADLPAAEPGTAVVAGGTWLFSAPQAHLTALVDGVDNQVNEQRRRAAA